MKLPLDTPTITAHALGELPSAEARLLRLTFHSEVAARYLEEEAQEIKDTAEYLGWVLKADALERTDWALSDEHRNRVLALTAEPYPKGQSAPVPAVPKVPLTMDKILAERKLFDTRPSRFATYATAGAAAALIILFSVLHTAFPSKGGASNLGSGQGTGQNSTAITDENDTTGSTHFKIVPVDPDKVERARERGRSVVDSAADFQELKVPQGPVLPKLDTERMSTDLPSPFPTKSKLAQTPDPAPNPEATPKDAPDQPAPKKKKKDPVYAVPKPK